jgi:ribosomal protein S18 acetylase RimI-like enzyme
VRGTVLEVREAVTEDAPALLALYERLDPDDTHRRFFSAFHPRLAFVEDWIAVRERGGVVLVAELVDAGPEGPLLVGEAGYAPVHGRGHDVAELAVTVDRSWRGWLGPFLLDVLVEHARTHGIADLVAEVLTTNCAMLAMLRARGCAFEPHRDMTTVKALIGTAGPTPVWPTQEAGPEGSPRVRLLVEGSSWSGALAAQDTGMAVLVCPGPERGRLHPCPLLTGQHCPLVDEADAVVVLLPGSAPTTAALLDAHRAAAHPLVELEHGLTGAEAVDVVRRSLRRRDAEEPVDDADGITPVQVAPDDER